MQITIDVEPTTLAMLDEMKEKGVSLDSVLRNALLKFDHEETFQTRVSAEAWVESLKKWANERRKLPELNDADFRRESIYEDRV